MIRELKEEIQKLRELLKKEGIEVEEGEEGIEVVEGEGAAEEGGHRGGGR